MTASEHLNSQKFGTTDDEDETGFRPFSSYEDEDYDDGVSYRPFSDGHKDD